MRTRVHNRTIDQMFGLNKGNAFLFSKHAHIISIMLYKYTKKSWIKKITRIFEVIDIYESIYYII